MDDLPSLSFPTPWHGGLSGKKSSSSSRIRVQYKALPDTVVGDMDEIPLMSGDDGGTDDEGFSGKSDDEGEDVIFDQLGGRQRWQRRIRSRSTLFNLICDGGWQLMLRKLDVKIRKSIYNYPRSHMPHFSSLVPTIPFPDLSTVNFGSED